jgi:hypothetical protein
MNYRDFKMDVVVADSAILLREVLHFWTVCVKLTPRKVTSSAHAWYHTTVQLH